ncbi:MAG: response regulator [Pseudomonadota bacterium]
MKNKTKILAVEDDVMFQELLLAIFSDYQIQVAGSGEEGLSMVKEFKPDIILLDINLPGIDGYQTCSELKNNELTRSIPVLFLSQYQTLEDRLKAYGLGGIDYISKPFDKNEVLIKVKQHIENKIFQDELTKDLQDSNNTVMDIQMEMADIQIIGRFLQANLFCRDFNSLFDLFFKTAQELGVSCVLQIKYSHDKFICSDKGNISTLENEIIEMSSSMERIHSFGKDRAMFNWSNANLLVRNLGSKIDLLAILMNGLDVSIQVILSEQELLSMVSELEQKNELLKDEISDIFGEMSFSLKDTFLSLGILASLEPDEEDKLNDKVEIYHQKLETKLNKLSSNNQQIKNLIDEMRSPKKAEEEESAAVLDSISFL